MFCSFSYLLRIYPLTRCFSSCSPLRGVSLVSKFIGLREDYDLTNFLDELVAFCVLYSAHQALSPLLHIGQTLR
jgi:hypothetical protein